MAGAWPVRSSCLQSTPLQICSCQGCHRPDAAAWLAGGQTPCQLLSDCHGAGSFSRKDGLPQSLCT